MQLLSILAIAAFAGTSLATPVAAAVEAAGPLPSCFNGMFYGEVACKQYCKGGQCSLLDGHQNDNDYICVCKDTSKPGCGGMFKGKDACQATCSNGSCTQLLLPYVCKCPDS